MYYKNDKNQHYKVDKKKSVRVSEEEYQKSENNLNRFGIKDLKTIAKGYNREVTIKNIGKLGKKKLIEEIVKATKKYPYFHQRVNRDIFKLIKYFEDMEMDEIREKEMKKIEKLKKKEEKLKEKEKELKEKEENINNREKEMKKIDEEKQVVIKRKSPIVVKKISSKRKSPIVVKKISSKRKSPIVVKKISSKKRTKPVKGDIVKIIIKPYDKKVTVNGIVKDVLTKKEEHTKGHKVRLQDGTIGRLVKILKAKNK